MAYPYQRITSDDDLLRSKKSPVAVPTVAPTVFSDENAYTRSIARGFTTPSNSVVRKPGFSNVVARSGTLHDFTNVKGGVRSTEFPDFSNVEGGASATVPDKGSALARRAAPQISTPGAYGYAAPNVGSPDDRERKAALSSLDSALFGLGNLNMRSKRELFGQLLGMKQDLTKTAFNADNERVQLRAKIGADAAEGNARLAESAAQRRSSADMFNAESSEKRDMFDTEREDKRAAAAAEAPMRALEAAYKRAQIESLDAGTRMKAGEYDVKREDARRAQYLKDNPGATNADFDEAFAREQAAMGFDPTKTEGGARGDAAINERIRNLINQDENFLVETLTSGYDGMLNDERVDSLNLNDVHVGRNDSVGATLSRIGSALTPFTDYDEDYGYYVEAAGAKPGLNRRSTISKAEHDRIAKYLTERAAARRRGE